MAMSRLLCFREVTLLAGSEGKLVALWTILAACKPLSDSTEKEFCKHRPYFSYEKKQELYHEGKMGLPPLRIPRNGNVPGGATGCW